MRIAIVNDLPIAMEATRRVLESAGSHAIAWTARDGAEAVKRCAEDRPELILMDLIMPVMDGVEATRRIMANTPCPILVVTATVDGNSGRVFEALGAGAIDAVNTPVMEGAAAATSARALLAKVDLMSRLNRPSAAPWAGRQNGAIRGRLPTGGGVQLVAVGCSAGGPAALAEVVRDLPRGFAGAFVVVQHLDEQFAAGFGDWLAQQTVLPVRLAREGDVPQPGTVLVAGRDEHLILRADRTLGYTAQPTETPYRPSVDVFFRSVAEHWQAPAVGLILTGMGRDGAAGLKQLRDAGFPTLAQDRATSAVYGMPKAAFELGAVEQVLPLAQIGPALQRLCQAPARPAKP
jgi:two-component system, chemotaxis family, response regulator WspF